MAAGGNRNILIVEDDREFRQTLAEQLRLHEEFDVEEAGTAPTPTQSRVPKRTITAQSCWMWACPTWMVAMSVVCCGEKASMYR